MMLTKKEQRLRRARQTRIRIATQGVARLTVNRTNLHIYASVISGDGAKILASASTAEAEVRTAWVAPARVATPQRRKSLASVWLKKPRQPASKRSPSTVQVLPTMAASRRWPMPRVKPACSFKKIGN